MTTSTMTSTARPDRAAPRSASVETRRSFIAAPEWVVVRVSGQPEKRGNRTSESPAGEPRRLGFCVACERS